MIISGEATEDADQLICDYIYDKYDNLNPRELDDKCFSAMRNFGQTMRRVLREEGANEVS